MESDIYYITQACGTEYRYFGKYNAKICFSRVWILMGYANRVDEEY